MELRKPQFPGLACQTSKICTACSGKTKQLFKLPLNWLLHKTHKSLKLIHINLHIFPSNQTIIYWRKNPQLFITPRFRYYILCTAWTAVTFRFSETSSESRILPFQCVAVHVIHPILPSHWWCHQETRESKRTRIRPKKIWLHELPYTKIVKI